MCACPKGTLLPENCPKPVSDPRLDGHAVEDGTAEFVAQAVGDSWHKRSGTLHLSPSYATWAMVNPHNSSYHTATRIGSGSSWPCFLR